MKTILVADDEANLRKLVRATLEDPRYRIVEAQDGWAALALLRKERPASAIGIHHYLVKPFSPRELLEKVEAVLEGTALRESTEACGIDSKVSRI